MDDALRIARTALESIVKGDYAGATAAFAKDAEWHNTADFPDERVLRGRSKVVSFAIDFLGEFSRGQLEIEHSVGDEGLVVLGLHSRGSARDSGIPLDVRWAATVRVRDGSIVRVDARGDFHKAVRAAGLAG